MSFPYVFPRASRTLLALAGLVIAVSGEVRASAALPIRNRLQWLENNGYCGETSLQESALYHGIYASQAYVRGIFDPTQQNDLVELEEWAQVLATLGLRADAFPTDTTPEPQYQKFAVWMKRHLDARRPVIVSAYIFEERESGSPVDHLMTATGWIGANASRYDDADTFVFNDHYRSTAAYALKARWAFDTRAMSENGAIYGISLPKERNYGLAILGTTNRAPEARPVRVELDRIDEPDLAATPAEAPTALAATLTIEALTPGKTYVLYRYNDPAKVPTSRYAAAPHDGAVRFKAVKSTHVFSATIASDSFAAFRCLPAGK